MSIATMKSQLVRFFVILLGSVSLLVSCMRLPVASYLVMLCHVHGRAVCSVVYALRVHWSFRILSASYPCGKEPTVLPCLDCILFPGQESVAVVACTVGFLLCHSRPWSDYDTHPLLYSGVRSILFASCVYPSAACTLRFVCIGRSHAHLAS